MNKLEFLITGTGKCGTVYMANLLSQLEIPCGHEAIFTNKGLEEAKKRLSDPTIIRFSECTKNLPKWTNEQNIVSDSSYMCAPFLDWDHLKDTKIIHIVRNPIEVISSFIKGEYFNLKWPEITIPFQNFIKIHVPQVYENDLNNINRCALYYVEWNKMIEHKLLNKNYMIYKIENSLEQIYEFVNKIPQKEINIDKKINSWKPTKKIQIKELIPEIRKNIIDIFDKYDYNYKLF